MRPRHVGVLLVVLAGAAVRMPPSGAQEAPEPLIRHHGTTGECSPGQLFLSAVEEQSLPAGSAVTVTDVVTEAGSTRELSSVEIPVPVDVSTPAAVGLDTTIEIAHHILFRSITGTAVFTVVRTTRLYVDGSAASGRPVHEEEITATCNGSGPATIAVRGRRIEAARPITAEPLYTG